MASSPVATLANVLHQVRTMEEWQNRSSAMLNKLALDMKDVATRVQELELSHQSALREINGLLQRFGEQMAISRRKEQEKTRLAFVHLREEMEEERNACRFLKMQNKQLTKDLTDANIAAADACEELDRERKARELLEEVCNELAREIGEDKAEVEQLKQEQAESRQTLEEELRMMRITAARWRGEKVWSTPVTKGELEMDYGKQGKPLRELRNKLEAFVGTMGVTCRGSQEDIERKAEQVKLLRQALELLELEEARERENHTEDVASAVSLANGTPHTKVFFIAEKASSKMDLGNEGNHFEGDRNTADGGQLIDGRLFSRKPRKARRRLRTSAQQRHNSAILRSQAKAYGQTNGKVWKTHCANLAWSSSDGEPGRSQSTIAQKPMQVRVVEQAVNDKGQQEHANANSENLVLERSDLARHIIQTMRPVLSELSSKQEPNYQNVCNVITECSKHKHFSSARFEVGTAGRERDCKQECDTGSGMPYSFSEDDVANYMGSRTERRRKQQGILHEQIMHSSKTVQEEEGTCSFTRNVEQACQDRQYHGHPDNSKSIGRGEAGSDSDDFYFEPVRKPGSTSFNNKQLSHKANENETGSYAAGQLETDVSNCGDEACCRIMAKASSHGCRELKDKVHENIAESSRSLASQEVASSLDVSTPYGGKEGMNKTSPWRSTSAKPLPCFWPPSPDAFSIFGGGTKKRSKAGSSTRSVSMDTEQEQPLNGGASLHLQTQRYPSPAKEVSYPEAASQQHHNCVKGNSLGAQLIKAREHDKPVKPSFRFSPLRRAISHG